MSLAAENGSQEIIGNGIVNVTFKNKPSMTTEQIAAFAANMKKNISIDAKHVNVTKLVENTDVDSEPTVPVTQGIIIYTDGGARPNPGAGGWGIHGYMYRKEGPKKPNGASDHILTGNGYISKAENATKKLGIEGQQERRAYDRTVEVAAVHYIDGYGSFAIPISNNVAELVATISGLNYAADYQIDDVQVYTDSEYVRKGLENWVIGWKNNNWLKADMTPPSNVEHWKQLVEVKERLTQRGVNVKINWVRSHGADLGNTIADRLATIGVMASRAGIATSCIDSTTAEGYWKYTTDRHPMLSHRRMYFNTMTEYLRPGEYYLGDHGKDDDLLGKRISDGAYAVVILEKPDSIIEMLRNHQSKLAKSTDTIMMARLDNLYRSDTHQSLSKYGFLAVEQPNMYRMDLTCYGRDPASGEVKREPLTREMQPPMLAMRAVESVSELAEKLIAFLAGNEHLIVTDLTSIIYETTVKVVKKGETTPVMKLKAEYNVGYAALAVDANYKSPSGDVKKAPITLTLGIDLLDRNALKRLEDSNPKVSLISWLEAPNVFRYATVIEAGNDKGIWAGVHSNLRIVTEQ
jgi:ribonuclease HI